MNQSAPGTRTGVRTALTLLLLSFAPVSARADVPSPPFSVVERILFAGPSGIPTPQCDDWPLSEPGFQVIVRNFFNLPIAGATVTLDVSGTALVLYPDTRPGTTVNCANRTISRVTDAGGRVSFAARLGGAAPVPSVEVSADGVLLDLVRVRTADYDGDGLVGIADFALFSLHYNQLGSPESTDLDGCTGGPDGPSSLGDFAIFAQEYLTEITDRPCP